MFQWLSVHRQFRNGLFFSYVLVILLFQCLSVHRQFRNKILAAETDNTEIFQCLSIRHPRFSMLHSPSSSASAFIRVISG
jgi:hypothetical protein